MNTIYNEIKDEFGVEATSAYYKAQLLPITIAQRINAKYPATGSSRFDMVINPKAVLIAKRYMSLVMGVK